ncbi:MAG: hypothetical protein A3C02_02855 [Candidatus Andersenbacteria bacterium RIFCSPHIGHO2_02_FULL_45_11]|nr:MAG: hypothetical protein A2805_02880 [Candidatus Andersenbacteria bacterium RIFCSPHIGHO2_01_FULL_46_36]OGY32121.1 MAG: hypothetical protein A3C02_02855 [Candidatus Andersenbacteria bacterium RIFCSPHIGHO2_02_FULL_45_11]
MIGIAPVAHANGFQYVFNDTGNNSTALIVSSPVHNSTIASPSTVHYSSEYTWVNCGNGAVAGIISLYVPGTPGKYTFENDGATTWKKIKSNTETFTSAEARRVVALSGDLTLTGAPKSSTTLKTVAKWKYLEDPVDYKRSLRLDYTWLHFVGPKQTPAPSPTPSASPTPTPTTSPIPTATPTPTTTPNPTPTPEVKIKEKGLQISKTDHKTLLRPGNTSTYEILVENTGEIDFHDLDITDTLPSNLTIQSVGQGGAVSDKKVTWTGIELGSGESKTFIINVKVNANTANNTNLHNIVTAVTNDNDLSDNATDDTLVQTIPKVAGVTIKVTPAPQPVPVSAKTGSGMPLAVAVSTIFGGSGLAWIVRKSVLG